MIIYLTILFDLISNVRLESFNKNKSTRLSPEIDIGSSS